MKTARLEICNNNHNLSNFSTGQQSRAVESYCILADLIFMNMKRDSIVCDSLSRKPLTYK